MNTRTATALERANVPRNQWNIVDKTKTDPRVMNRLREQLERNKISPGQAISKPASDIGKSGQSGEMGESGKSPGGGLLGSIGRATGPW